VAFFFIRWEYVQWIKRYYSRVTLVFFLERDRDLFQERFCLRRDFAKTKLCGSETSSSHIKSSEILI
jgi:hypothetical protein